MKIWPATAVCYCLLFATSAVHASSLISGDDAVFGPDSITIDTATGLEWLDWTLSTNRSYDDVSTQFGVGGNYEGWRHATAEEAVVLFQNAGITNIDSDLSNPRTVVSDLVSLLGDTTTNLLGVPGSVGITGSLSDDPESRFIGVLDPTGQISPASNSAYVFTYDLLESFAADPYGHALVRSSNLIPEPSTIALLAIGLLVVGGHVSRKSR